MDFDKSAQFTKKYYFSNMFQTMISLPACLLKRVIVLYKINVI